MINLKISINSLLLLGICFICGCASAPKKDVPLENIKQEVATLKASPEVKDYAYPILIKAIQAANAAIDASRSEEKQHYIYMAEKYIEYTKATVARKKLERKHELINVERDKILLEIKTQQAEKARIEAEQERIKSLAIAEDAARIKQEAQQAREEAQQNAMQAEQAFQEAQQAKQLADAQGREAELAKQEAQLASEAAAILEEQLVVLQATNNDQGAVFTLSGVAFDSGKSTLKPEAHDKFGDLLTYLSENPLKLIRIQGHTDNRGGKALNLELSRKRADAVKRFLVEQGIDDSRIETVGLGESTPIASNETIEGRKQNRRVEVIVFDQ